MQPNSLKSVLVAIVAPLIGAVLFTLGNGYFTTVSTLLLHNMQGSVGLVGVMAAIYFAGLMFGSYHTQHVVLRVGHIRAFAIFASLMVVSTLLQGIFYNAIAWLVWRFVYGYSLAGLYLVVEGWLLMQAGKQFKGQVFGIYLMVFYLSLALAQLFVNLPLHQPMMIFAIIAGLAALAILPVSLTRQKAPEVEEKALVSPLVLIKKTPLGVLACIVSGMILGVVYSMLPLFFAQVHLHTTMIAWLMLTTIIGAAALQWPLGLYSDKVDRRFVLAGVCFATTLAAVLILLFHHELWLLFILVFVFGGFAFTVNPLSISHTSDYIDSDKIVSAMSTMILMYGFGSMIGPLVASAFINVLGPYGFFVYMIVVTLPLGAYALWRITQRKRLKPKDAANFMPTPAIPAGKEDFLVQDTE